MSNPKKGRAAENAAKKTPTLYQQGRLAFRNATKKARRAYGADVRDPGHRPKSFYDNSAVIATAATAVTAKDTRPHAGA